MAITITRQPTNAAVKVGDTVYFSVEAEGDSLIYQWQFMNPNVGFWNNSGMPGNQTASMSVEVLESRNGYKYRCVITDANGNQIRTNEVTLHIIDGALSADKGLVSMSTLSDIAKAIRAKTETTDRILPPDMAAIIEGIETGVEFPPSITEMEMVQVTMPSGVYDYDEVPHITVPCGMSEAPTGHVVWIPDQNWTSGRAGWICTDVRIPYRDTSGNMRSIDGVGGKTDLDFIDGINAGTWTLANGVATLTRGNSSKSYACGKPYTVIIWR